MFLCPAETRFNTAISLRTYSQPFNLQQKCLLWQAYHVFSPHKELLIQNLAGPVLSGLVGSTFARDSQQHVDLQ